ncbi:MAG: Tryptophan synthase alpha chain, partial [Myxococcales bacterium]|nr:Tryptophan synthase alpha chain [Myxococcales bacterium]
GGGGSGGSGGTGGTGGPTFGSTCSGAATTLEGVMLAPNGRDPVANGFAYVAASTNPMGTGVSCELCNMPIDGALVTATTDASGHFTLDLGGLPPSATVRLSVNKGRFRRTTLVTVNACQKTSVAAAQSTLPGKNGSDDDIPKIAIATGNKDQLDVVLNAIVLDAHVGFDCFEGRASASSSLTSPCGKRGALTPIETLLKNEAMLEQYNLVFLSCAPGKWKGLSAADQQTIAANLQTWAQKGGRLFATDNSYDYVAQAFPAAVTFMNGNMSVDAANVGYGISGSGSQYSGRINDTTMAAWLVAVGALPAGSNTVALTGYLNKWSVIQNVPTTTNDVVDATDAQSYPTPTATMPGPATTYPQTIRFDVTPAGAANACGRVIYSSYHTLPTTTQPDPTQLVPQERILEYLMLEADACIGPIG